MCPATAAATTTTTATTRCPNVNKEIHRSGTHTDANTHRHSCHATFDARTQTPSDLPPPASLRYRYKHEQTLGPQSTRGTRWRTHVSTGDTGWHRNTQSPTDLHVSASCTSPPKLTHGHVRGNCTVQILYSRKNRRLDPNQGDPRRRLSPRIFPARTRSLCPSLPPRSGSSPKGPPFRSVTLNSCDGGRDGGGR